MSTRCEEGGPTERPTDRPAGPSKFHTRLETLWLMSLQGHRPKQADPSRSRLPGSLLLLLLLAVTRFAPARTSRNICAPKLSRRRRCRRRAQCRQMSLVRCCYCSTVSNEDHKRARPLWLAFGLHLALFLFLFFAMGHTSSKPRQPLSAHSFGAPLWLLNRIPFCTLSQAPSWLFNKKKANHLNKKWRAYIVVGDNLSAPHDGCRAPFAFSACVRMI